MLSRAPLLALAKSIYYTHANMHLMALICRQSDFNFKSSGIRTINRRPRLTTLAYTNSVGR